MRTRDIQKDFVSVEISKVAHSISVFNLGATSGSTHLVLRRKYDEQYGEEEGMPIPTLSKEYVLHCVLNHHIFHTSPFDHGIVIRQRTKHTLLLILSYCRIRDIFHNTIHSQLTILTSYLYRPHKYFLCLRETQSYVDTPSSSRPNTKALLPPGSHLWIHETRSH